MTNDTNGKRRDNFASIEDDYSNKDNSSKNSTQFNIRRSRAQRLRSPTSQNQAIMPPQAITSS